MTYLGLTQGKSSWDQGAGICATRQAERRTAHDARCCGGTGSFVSADRRTADRELGRRGPCRGGVQSAVGTTRPQPPWVPVVDRDRRSPQRWTSKRAASPVPCVDGITTVRRGRSTARPADGVGPGDGVGVIAHDHGGLRADGGNRTQQRLLGPGRPVLVQHGEPLVQGEPVQQVVDAPRAEARDHGTAVWRLRDGRRTHESDPSTSGSGCPVEGRECRSASTLAIVMTGCQCTCGRKHSLPSRSCFTRNMSVTFGPSGEALRRFSAA